MVKNSEVRGGIVFSRLAKPLRNRSKNQLQRKNFASSWLQYPQNGSETW